MGLEIYSLVMNKFPAETAAQQAMAAYRRLIEPGRKEPGHEASTIVA